MTQAAATYRRRDADFTRRALVTQAAVGLGVGTVGLLLIRLFVAVPARHMPILAVLVWAIYAIDGALAVVALRPCLNALRQWIARRDGVDPRAVWSAIAAAPFAPLQRKSTYAAIITLIVAWDWLVVRLQGLPTTSLLLLAPGSMLVWLYWLALRFLITEQLVRPVLADISTQFANSIADVQVRVTLTQRLLVTIPAITVIAGTVVAGVVGDHTAATVAVGVGVSTLVALGISGLLIVLLARSVSGPVADLRVAADRIAGGDFTVSVPVESVDEIGALADAFNAMAAGLRERERLRAVFGSYVDPTVADHVLTSSDESLAAGEEVEITALFLDVRGFTSYSERLPARDVVRMLNRLFTAVVPIIARRGGHVDKFIGDGLLAVFGVPERHIDHAQRALAAAQDIAAALGHSVDDQPGVGIGLNSGTVVAGNIGGAGRFDFTVVGDTVNVAARIESATRQTGDVILLSEHTRQQLPPEIQHRLASRPTLPLKGKSEEVRLYAALTPPRSAGAAP